MSRWSAADLNRVAKASKVIQDNIRAPLKYGNVPTTVGKFKFDSQLEAKRFQELELLKKAGTIDKLQFHRHWDLHVNGQLIGYYEADFTYTENGETVIEDTKGFKTPLYRWKKKHLFAEYGIKIREINA